MTEDRVPHPALPPCPICGRSDLFIGRDGKPGCPHCEVSVILPDRSAAQPAPALDVELRAALTKAREQLVIEHGHDSDSDAAWPACRYVHPVLDEASAALTGASPSEPFPGVPNFNEPFNVTDPDGAAPEEEREP